MRDPVIQTKYIIAKLDEDGEIKQYFTSSLRILRKNCIADFIKDDNKPFSYYQEKGWQCVKVVVTIEPFKKYHSK